MNLIMTHLKYGGMVLGATAAIGLLVIQPAYKKRQALLHTVMQLETRVAEGETDHALLAATQDRVKSIRQTLDNDTRLIPDSSDVAGIINAISRDIASLGLGNARMNRGKETALGGTASVGLNIETIGPFDTVVELLERIEDQERLVRISTFTAKPLDSESGVVQALIGLDAYYRVAPRPTEASASAAPTGTP